MEPTPNFWHFAGIYLNEDWPLEYGDPWVALDAFLTESPELAAGLGSEIEMILAQPMSEPDLGKFVEAQGAAYLPTPNTGGYRAWLTEISRRTAAATGR